MFYSFNDKLVTKTSKRRITDEGYLDLPARISRVGVQPYLAGEIGLKDRDPKEVINVYRPPEEVFNDVSLASFQNKPVTDDHPPVKVTAKNNKQYSVGSSYGDITHDKTYVNARLLITDADMIEKISKGKAEVSNGYKAKLEFTSGVVDGVKYDAVQRKIKGNHIAIVMRGRAGRNVRLSDNKPKGNQTVKVTLNDIEYDIEDGAAASAAKKLSKDNDKLKDKLEKQGEKHSTEMAAKDSEIDKLKKENKELKDAKPDVKKLVSDRLKFEKSVSVIDSEYKIEDKEDGVVKRELLQKHRKSLDVNDETQDSYVDAAFDILASDAEATAARNHTTDSALGAAHQTQTHRGGANQQSHMITDSDGKKVDTRSPDEIAREKMIKDNQSMATPGDAS